MNRRTIAAGIAIGWIAPCLCLGEVPKDYPNVALSTRSPVYAALSVNPFTNECAYVVFDGDTDNGYRRAYVWIPGHPQYGTPGTLTADEKNRFPPFRVVRSSGDEEAAVEWTLSWQKSVHGPTGPQEVLDYTTGKKVTVGKASAGGTNIIFSGGVNYRRGPKGSCSGPSGQSPLEIVVGSQIGVFGGWSNAPAVGLAPWRGIGFNLSYEIQQGKDLVRAFEKEVAKGQLKPLAKSKEASKDSGGISARNMTRVGFKPALTCQVISLPNDAEINLEVYPWLENTPIAKETVGYDQLVGGLALDIPYGWYDFAYNFKCRWLGGISNRVSMCAIAKPASAATP